MKNAIIIKPNQKIFNPITLDINENKDNKINNLSKFNDFENTFNGSYPDFLLNPPITINEIDILKIYDINNDILEWYEKSDNNIIHKNRILNCWIRINYDKLKKNNNILKKIYIKIISNLIENEDINFEKEINNYIDYWIEKNNNTQFKLNLLDDMIKYFFIKFKISIIL
jgi:hypothetical protein